MNISYKNYQDYGLKYPKASSPQEIMENIEYLYEKIKHCTRDLSYYDLYRIKDIVTNPSELQSKINSLDLYSSLVINTNIQEGDQTYNIGDIVIKLSDGKTELIKAQRGGIFYPSKISKGSGSTYSIDFTYNASAPEQPSLTTQINEKATNLAKQMTFTGLTGGVAGSPYNKIVTSGFNDITLTAAKTQDFTPIVPNIHIYHKTANNQWEEIYADEKVVLSGDNYLVSISVSETIGDMVVIK